VHRKLSFQFAGARFVSYFRPDVEWREVTEFVNQQLGTKAVCLRDRANPHATIRSPHWKRMSGDFEFLIPTIALHLRDKRVIRATDASLQMLQELGATFYSDIKSPKFLTAEGY
jgi:hypothetical protein